LKKTKQNKTEKKEEPMKITMQQKIQNCNKKKKLQKALMKYNYE
jgi:hypothetical protein